MAKKRINVGLIGYQFMGKAHSNAYRQVGRFFPELPVEVGMHTLCGRNEAKVREAAEVYGWENVETDWKKVVENPEIDVILSNADDSFLAESVPRLGTDFHAVADYTAETAEWANRVRSAERSMNTAPPGRPMPPMSTNTSGSTRE